MSLAISQDVVVHIAKALWPVTQYMRSWVPDNLAYVPAFMIFFIQLFSISMLWIRYVNIGGKKAPFLGSCAMSRSVQLKLLCRSRPLPLTLFQILPSICTAINVFLSHHKLQFPCGYMHFRWLR
jgi:hypothetical protein